MLKKSVNVCLGLVLMLLIEGCSGPAPAQRNPLDLTLLVNHNKSDALALAQTVLSRLNFAIAKADARTGTLETHPLSGAHFFEFWRGDVVGGFQSLESNLHSTRRVVELSLTEQGHDTLVRCTVHTQRLNVPSNPIHNAHAYQMLSSSTSRIQRLKLSPYQEENMMWTDLGPDYELGQKIAGLIKNESLKKNLTQG
jgi:hypothetical protein